MVWYSPKLQFRKFPLLVPFLCNWKSDTWQWATSWTFTWDFSFVTCSMTFVWLACSAKRMSRTSHSVQGTGEPAVLRPTCAQPTKSDRILTASPSAKKVSPHPKRTRQSWFVKSLTEIWQPFLFILHFQNFFTWHLIDGECCWRKTFSLKMHTNAWKKNTCSLSVTDDFFIYKITDEISKANNGFVLNKITLPAAMSKILCLEVDETSQNCWPRSCVPSVPTVNDHIWCLK